MVLVHIGGLITPHAAELAELCRASGAALIEDAAHAHGATFGGRFAGSFGLAAAFSFYPTKVVTCGEGGMILTASDELADEAMIYRDQGKGSFGANHHVRHGYAWRMSEQNAATGLVHLRRMTSSIARRREVAARYNAGLAGLSGLRPLAEPAGCVSNIYKYIAVLDPGIDRAWFKEQLATRHDVRLAGEVYDLPLHLQPILEEYALGQSLPVAEDALRPSCLPPGPLRHARRRDRPGAHRGHRGNRGARMRVAVTGGCGFIGSHVVDHLVSAGHEVLVIDVAEQWRNDGAEYLLADLFDPAAIDAALAGRDAVFHLAGAADVNEVAADPVRALRLNIEGVGRVLDSARRQGCARVVLASTVWVYGATVGSGERTEDAFIDLRKAGHLYVSTKLAAEMLMHSYQQMFGQEFTILRYGIPYGPRMRDALVVARFVGAAQAGQPITIAGTGDQQRNFVYVEDLAQAHVLALSPAAANQTLALEGDTPVSVNEIAETVQHLVEPGADRARGRPPSRLRRREHLQPARERTSQLVTDDPARRRYPALPGVARRFAASGAGRAGLTGLTGLTRRLALAGIGSNRRIGVSFCERESC